MAGIGEQVFTVIWVAKTLADHVDGVNYLVKNYGVDPKHVGIYGGSYGGFITLMGMFTQAGCICCRAALTFRYRLGEL